MRTAAFGLSTRRRYTDMPVAKEIYHAMDDPKMQKMVIDTQ